MPEKTFGPGVSPTATIAIGIDQSLTGFAISFVEVGNESAHDTRVYKSNLRGVARLNDIAAWLQRRLDAHQRKLVYDVAMEGTVRASMAASVLGELAGVTKLVLWHHFATETHARPLLVPPMTLKKYVTGVGTAKKNEMLLKTFTSWGIEFSDDNAADAYGLARLSAGSFSNKVQSDIISKLSDVKYRD